MPKALFDSENFIRRIASKSSCDDWTVLFKTDICSSSASAATNQPYNLLGKLFQIIKKVEEICNRLVLLCNPEFELTIYFKSNFYDLQQKT